MTDTKHLQFEENFESLSIKALNQVGLTGLNARFSDQLTDQKIQVVFETNGNLDEAVMVDGNYRKYLGYEGVLAFIVTTNRANIRNHAEKLSKVRYIMFPENAYLENEYYQILETREESANTQADEETNSDITLLTFNIKFLIK